MFEQVFDNVDNILRREAGCATELDYTEQTSWILFLKYLDDLEKDRADEAYTKKTWHGPNLRQAIRGVSARQATPVTQKKAPHRAGLRGAIASVALRRWNLLTKISRNRC